MYRTMVRAGDPHPIKRKTRVLHSVWVSHQNRCTYDPVKSWGTSFYTGHQNRGTHGRSSRERAFRETHTTDYGREMGRLNSRDAPKKICKYPLDTQAKLGWQ